MIQCDRRFFSRGWFNHQLYQLQGGPLLVVNRVTTPISRVITPKFMSGDRAHLVVYIFISDFHHGRTHGKPPNVWFGKGVFRIALGEHPRW